MVAAWGGLEKKKKTCFNEPTNKPKGVHVIVCKVCNVLYFKLLLAFNVVLSQSTDIRRLPEFSASKFYILNFNSPIVLLLVSK